MVSSATVGEDAAGGATHVTPRAERFIIYREPGTYAAFPRLAQLPDGRLTVGLSRNSGKDHHLLGKWGVLVSADNGATWSFDDDPALPLNWPGSSTRERWDRLTAVLPDGMWLAAGVVGWQAWAEERRPEALEDGR